MKTLLTSLPHSVLTTKILAIGRLTALGETSARVAVMPSEVQETITLYLAGRIDQWFFQTKGNGVVFILNITDTDEARDLLEGLPLGKAGMMLFEFVPLGPLMPLSLLL